VTSTLRPSRPKRSATIVVGLALISAVGLWVTNSPLFEMRSLSVNGNQHLSDARVARLAGLSRTTNVLWLRTGATARRIERDPWVLRAEVSRTLPGAITISIEERRAVAVVEGRRSTLLLVSGDGMILGRASRKSRLPVIRVPGATETVGSRISGSPAELIVARTLPATLRGRVKRVARTSRGSLTLILRDGVSVLYGDASDAGAKARAVASLLSWAHQRGIRADYIDVRAPGAPALLPMAAAASR
jgi:cell division protein FtsQ